MKNCGACYYRDSTWSSQHREMSARCDHDNAPEESLLELRVGADSVVGAPCWCPLETEDTKVTDEIRHTYTFITDTNVVMLRSHYAQLVKERAEALYNFTRVADALGLVSTDDTGRIGDIASVEDIVAQARLAARALSREQLEPEVDE